MLQPVPRCRYIWLNEGRTACYYLLAGEPPPLALTSLFSVSVPAGGLAPIASTKPPHLRQDGPPGWDGETIERSDRAPGNGPRALFFTCLLGDRPRRPGGLLDQAGAAELAAVEALERGRAFPYSIPCPMGKRRGWVPRDEIAG